VSRLNQHIPKPAEKAAIVIPMAGKTAPEEGFIMIFTDKIVV